jgi:hypothetical protein
MTISPEYLELSEVRHEWSQMIDDTARPLAEKHELAYEAYYHDMPLWYVGDLQLGLVRREGIEVLEIHKGDNHLSLQIEKLGKEALGSVVECLIVSTP